MAFKQGRDITGVGEAVVWVVEVSHTHPLAEPLESLEVGSPVSYLAKVGVKQYVQDHLFISSSGKASALIEEARQHTTTPKMMA